MGSDSLRDGPAAPKAASASATTHAALKNPLGGLYAAAAAMGLHVGGFLHPIFARLPAPGRCG